MTMVNVQNDLYKKIEKFIAKNSIKYTTLRQFVNLAVKEKLEGEGG